MKIMPRINITPEKRTRPDYPKPMHYRDAIKAAVEQHNWTAAMLVKHFGFNGHTLESHIYKNKLKRAINAKGGTLDYAMVWGQYIEGMSQGEIAEYHDISLSSVSAIIKRLRKMPPELRHAHIKFRDEYRRVMGVDNEDD